MKFRLIILIILFIPIVKADFESWIFRGGAFIVGKPAPFIIYINNTGNLKDSYTITATPTYIKNGQDLSHLIKVHLPSNRIEGLNPGEIRETQGVILTVFKIEEPGGTLKFEIKSDSGVTHEISIPITSSFSIALSEFKIIGLIQLIFLILIISYTLHIS